jgi:hypothetical protein
VNRPSGDPEAGGLTSELPVEGAVASRAEPWWRRHVRVEDVILAIWLIVIAPLFAPTSGSGFATGPDPILGLVDLVGLLGFAACLGARSQPGVISGLMARGDVLYAVGPLFGALALTIDDIGARLALPDGLAVLPLLLAAGVAVAARFRLPPLTADQRRALVTPFVLVASRFFADFLGGLTPLFDLRQLVAGITEPDGFAGTAFVALIATVGVAIFYVMLVFAPRQIAEREGSPTSWTVRFVLFVVSLSLGQTVAGLVHG